MGTKNVEVAEEARRSVIRDHDALLVFSTDSNVLVEQHFQNRSAEENGSLLHLLAGKLDIVADHLLSDGQDNVSLEQIAAILGEISWQMLVLSEAMEARAGKAAERQNVA